MTMTADNLIRLARGLGRLAYRKHGERRGKLPEGGRRLVWDR